VPRTSIISQRKDRDKIEKAIIDGVPERQIASRFKLSNRAVHDYKRSISERMKLALEKRDVLTINYLEETESLRQIALKQLREVQDASEEALPIRVGMLTTALRTAGEFTDRLTRYTGQSLEKKGGDTNVQINVFEFMPIVRATLLQFPDALAAVEQAMKVAGNGSSH
jgi:hypothetical protein